MDYEALHRYTFTALYACLAVLSFVILERGIYLAYVSWRARALERLLPPGALPDLAAVAGVAAGDPLSANVARYAQAVAAGASRARQEDLSGALYLVANRRIGARLWILDTLITAAPLLGLLGTILGIMETFDSLSAGGISDPAAVSRGIGNALIATALGIATALLGLLGHSILHQRAELLGDALKSFLLRLTP